MNTVAVPQQRGISPPRLLSPKERGSAEPIAACRRPHSLSRRLSWHVAFLLLPGASNLNAASFVEWQRQQEIQVPGTGLVSMSLPAETLNTARPGLEDLRLVDAHDNEVPYLIDRSKPGAQMVHSARSFRSRLEGRNTVIVIETGLKMPLTQVLLETPARQFIKAVRVEGSHDGQRWQHLADGIPIFRQAGGASGLAVEFKQGEWPWIRLTIDDRRSEPVPFTGVRLRASAEVIPPTEPVPVTITARNEGPNETRLTLDLGAANLMLASIEVGTDEPLFTRKVALAATAVAEDGAREQTLASGTLLRFGGNGQPEVVQSTLTVECQTPSRELVLRIRNEDSPPLTITAIRAWRRPVNLVFHAREAGEHRLYLGNPLCKQPRYDIAALCSQLRTRSTQVMDATSAGLSDNPAYQAPEALPGLSLVGSPLDTSPWKYRKPVRIHDDGVQTLELDLEVLANGQRGFGDLRLVRDGHQVPFLVEHTSITRTVQPEASQEEDPKRPTVARWLLKLPLENLPANRLVCSSSTPLFERRVRVFEEVADDRGARRIRELGSASWSRTPERRPRLLELTLSQTPRTDTLHLETDNGDNPPIQLDAFQLFYPVTRLVFKAATNEAPMLYYGNARVRSPNYDLRLVGRQLLAAPRTAATLGAQEALKASTGTEGSPLEGVRGVLFWSVLGVVVVALLVIIARVLPKAPSARADT